MYTPIAIIEKPVMCACQGIKCHVLCYSDTSLCFALGKHCLTMMRIRFISNNNNFAGFLLLFTQQFKKNKSILTP